MQCYEYFFDDIINNAIKEIYIDPQENYFLSTSWKTKNEIKDDLKNILDEKSKDNF